MGRQCLPKDPCRHSDCCAHCGQLSRCLSGLRDTVSMLWGKTPRLRATKISINRLRLRGTPQDCRSWTSTDWLTGTGLTKRRENSHVPPWRTRFKNSCFQRAQMEERNTAYMPGGPSLHSHGVGAGGRAGDGGARRWGSEGLGWRGWGLYPLAGEDTNRVSNLSPTD